MSDPMAAARPMILVVDDDDNIRDVLFRALGNAGYEVICAQNGREALDLISSRGRPALILLDLDMPVMNGWEFRLQQRRDPALAVIPVVITSASSQIARAAEVLNVGAFLRKPLNIRQMISIVGLHAAGPA